MAHPAYGTRLEISDEGTPPLWTLIAEIKTLGGPSFQCDAIEKTHLNSPGACKEFNKGEIDGGEITFEGNYTPSQAGTTHDDLLAHIKAATASALKQFRILWPDTLAWSHSFTGAEVDTGNNKLDIVGHLLESVQRVRFTNSGGALPTTSPQIVPSTVYYVTAPTVDALQIYTTEADARAETNVITISAVGNGTHYIWAQAVHKFSAFVSNFTPTAQGAANLELAGTLKVTGPVTRIDVDL